MLFRKKKPEIRSYDRSRQRPVLLCSICTGEETAGFRDLETGRFTEVMAIRSRADLEEFCRLYEVENIRKEY